MKTLLAALGLTMAVASTGCTLYFGPEGDDGSCPPGTVLTYDEYGPVCVGGDGYYCSSDYECAAGCYCDNTGYCAESSYCSTDADCWDGYTCDESRGTCDPDGGPGFCVDDTQCGAGNYCDELTGQCLPSWQCDPAQPDACGAGYFCNANWTCEPIGCTEDVNCAAGCYCDPNGTGCIESCYCATDDEAIAQGYGFCDEDRSTCMPGTDPDNGSCAGAITCNFGAPTCAAGSVPLIKDGCYTGECTPVAECDVLPSCEALNTEGLCLARGECAPVYTGRNCTNSAGGACQAGDNDCTCESYNFDECRTATLE